MKRFPFLLLDAGPIIKLFSLGIWDEFIKSCDVTISRIIAEDQALYTEDGEKSIDLKPYEEKNLIKILDTNISIVKRFVDKFDPLYKPDIHDGEKETLAFLYESSENWLVCSADHVVFKILGLFGKGDQGISLEEVLTKIGLGSIVKWQKVTPQDKHNWPYTKKFHEKYTHLGQVDFIQGKGLL